MPPRKFLAFLESFKEEHKRKTPSKFWESFSTDKKERNWKKQRIWENLSFMIAQMLTRSTTSFDVQNYRTRMREYLHFLRFNDLEGAFIIY